MRLSKLAAGCHPRSRIPRSVRDERVRRDRVLRQCVLAHPRDLHLSAGFRVIVHEDNWKWGPEEKFSFREHEGRGYWRDDKWTNW